MLVPPKDGPVSSIQKSHVLSAPHAACERVGWTKLLDVIISRAIFSQFSEKTQAAVMVTLSYH